MNNFLFKAELMKLFFGDVHISAGNAQIIFYFSLILVAFYVMMFIFSVKKVFSFHAGGMTIDLQLRWLDFEERESFISKVEDAKDKRYHQLLSVN